MVVNKIKKGVPRLLHCQGTWHTYIFN